MAAAFGGVGDWVRPQDSTTAERISWTKLTELERSLADMNTVGKVHLSLRLVERLGEHAGLDGQLPNLQQMVASNQSPLEMRYLGQA